MSGTALSDWAMAVNPAQSTLQVAGAANCEINENFSDCLRNKKLDDTMVPDKLYNPYQTKLGPIVDSVVVSQEPRAAMMAYSDFKR